MRFVPIESRKGPAARGIDKGGGGTGRKLFDCRSPRKAIGYRGKNKKTVFGAQSERVKDRHPSAA